MLCAVLMAGSGMLKTLASIVRANCGGCDILLANLLCDRVGQYLYMKKRFLENTLLVSMLDFRLIYKY